MTNTYSGDPATSERDAIRFILSDTAAPWKWSDEEINYMITTFQNPYLAAAELAFQQSGKYTDRRDKTVGPLSIKYGEIGDRWAKFASELRKRNNSRGGAKAITTQRHTGPTHFRLGMHDIHYGHSLTTQLLGDAAFDEEVYTGFPIPDEIDGSITESEIWDGGSSL